MHQQGPPPASIPVTAQSQHTVTALPPLPTHPPTLSVTVTFTKQAATHKDHMRHHARARHRWHRERWSVALLAAAALIAVSGCGGVDTAEAKTKQRGRRGAMTGASKYSKSASAAASGEASRDVYDNEMMDLDVDEFEAVVMHPTVHHCEVRSPGSCKRTHGES